LGSCSDYSFSSVSASEQGSTSLSSEQGLFVGDACVTIFNELVLPDFTQSYFGFIENVDNEGIGQYFYEQFNFEEI